MDPRTYSGLPPPLADDDEIIEFVEDDEALTVSADGTPDLHPPEVEVITEDLTSETEVGRLLAGARDLYALGNFSGSLQWVERALVLDPTHVEARALLERNRGLLVQMYESKLGRLTCKPRVLLQPDEVAWLNLDHRAGFVLAQIDGKVTLEEVFALSGMGKLDTARILVELMEQGAIAF